MHMMLVYLTLVPLALVSWSGGLRAAGPQTGPLPHKWIQAPSVVRPLRLLSPNGGEFVRRNTRYPIRWRAAAGPGKLTIDLEYRGHRVGSIARYIPVSAGIYNWPVGRVLGRMLKDGPGYRIVINSADRQLLDKSDGDFTLVSPGYRIKPRPMTPTHDRRR